MTELSKKKCVPCLSDAAPLTGDLLRPLYMQLDEGWNVINEHHLEKEYHFKNFKKALEFANIVGKVAEEEGHHPDLYLSWGKLKIQLFTHEIEGLSESDFILAAKIEAEYVSHQGS